MNGRTVPSRQARISPSRMPSQRQVAGALDDLRELVADVVQVARVEPDLRRRARWSWARMPSYLSSTQTVDAEPLHDLGGVLGRRGEHELDRVEQGEAGVAEAVVAGEHRRPADVAGEHAGPLHLVERPVEGLRDRGLDEALAEPDPELAATGP